MYVSQLAVSSVGGGDGDTAGDGVVCGENLNLGFAKINAPIMIATTAISRIMEAIPFLKFMFMLSSFHFYEEESKKN